MPKMSAAVAARALATRTHNRNRRPLYVLAKILKQEPKTLAAKLLYHGVKPGRTSLPDLIAAVREHTRTRITPGMQRQLDALLAEPAPAEARGSRALAQNTPSKSSPPPEAETLEQLRKRLRLTVISLRRAEGLILPLVPGHYGELQLSVLEALRTAQGSA